MQTNGFTKQQMAVGGLAGVVILILGGRLLAQVANVIAPDTVPGYYAVTVNPAPDATPEQQSADMAFGMVRLSLNTDHTFRFGALSGTWKHVGGRVTLTPSSTSAPFETTTMAQALSAMARPIDFDVSKDGKTLSAEKPAHGPLTFTKTSEAFR